MSATGRRPHRRAVEVIVGSHVRQIQSASFVTQRSREGGRPRNWSFFGVIDSNKAANSKVLLDHCSPESGLSQST